MLAHILTGRSGYAGFLVNSPSGCGGLLSQRRNCGGCRRRTRTGFDSRAGGSSRAWRYGSGDWRGRCEHRSSTHCGGNQGGDSKRCAAWGQKSGSGSNNRPERFASRGAAASSRCRGPCRPGSESFTRRGTATAPQGCQRAFRLDDFIFGRQAHLREHEQGRRQVRRAGESIGAGFWRNGDPRRIEGKRCCRGAHRVTRRRRPPSGHHIGDRRWRVASDRRAGRRDPARPSRRLGALHSRGREHYRAAHLTRPRKRKFLIPL